MLRLAISISRNYGSVGLYVTLRIVRSTSAGAWSDIDSGIDNGMGSGIGEGRRGRRGVGFLIRSLARGPGPTRGAIVQRRGDEKCRQCGILDRTLRQGIVLTRPRLGRQRSSVDGLLTVIGI